MPLEIGLTAELERIVTDEMSAIALGSGDVAVFATPSMIALMEAAAVAAIAPHLSAEQSSVGVLISVKHLAASPIGATVRAAAELIALEGRVMRFKVVAWEGQTLIGDGEHERALIDRARFMARVYPSH